jgi:hypothetical protein
MDDDAKRPLSHTEGGRFSHSEALETAISHAEEAEGAEEKQRASEVLNARSFARLPTLYGVFGSRAIN